MTKAKERKRQAPKQPPRIETKLREVPMDAVFVSRNNHRDANGDVDVLAASIAEQGLQSPPLLTPMEKGDKFELVFGHRRYLACKKLKWDTLPALVADKPMSEAEKAAARITENVARLDATPIEEAIAVAKLSDAIKATLKKQLNDEQYALAVRDEALAEVIAHQLGADPRWVRDRFYFARLDGKARDLVQADRLPLQHAREIAKLADPQLQAQAAELAALREDGTGGWPIDQLRRWVNANMKSLRIVPWTMDAEFAGCVACATCPFNTANDRSLFEHEDPNSDAAKDESAKRESGLCTKHECFVKKGAAVEKAIERAVTKAVARLKEDDAASVADFCPAFVKPATFKRAVAAAVNKSAPDSGPATDTKPPKEETEAEKKNREQQEKQAAWFSMKQAFYAAMDKAYTAYWKQASVACRACLHMIRAADLAIDGTNQKRIDAIAKRRKDKNYIDLIHQVNAGQMSKLAETIFGDVKLADYMKSCDNTPPLYVVRDLIADAKVTMPDLPALPEGCVASPIIG